MWQTPLAEAKMETGSGVPCRSLGLCLGLGHRHRALTAACPASDLHRAQLPQVLLQELDIVQQLLLVAGQRDAQGGQVSGGEEGVGQVWAGSSKIPGRTPGLEPRGTPTPPLPAYSRLS